MREKGQIEMAKTLETPVFSRGIEILTEKKIFCELHTLFLILTMIFLTRQENLQKQLKNWSSGIKP